MDDLSEVSGIIRRHYGYTDMSLPLKNDQGDVASGVIETTAGERIAFETFHAYTLVEGFAAYVLKGDEEHKSILINRSHIQQIFID